MFDLKVEFKNQALISKAFKDAPRIMAKGLQDAFLKASGETLSQVKQVITTGEGMWKSPIDTGAMRRGIQLRQTGKLTAIMTPSGITPYAKFVHEGTRYMKARPFFEITAKNRKDRVNKFFNAEITDILKKIARSI